MNFSYSDEGFLYGVQHSRAFFWGRIVGILFIGIELLFISLEIVDVNVFL